MIEMLSSSLPQLMFLALAIFLLSGFPVAFALAATGLMFGFIGIEMAAYFGAMGSQVSIVEALPAVGGSIEPEAAAFLAARENAKGNQEQE